MTTKPHRAFALLVLLSVLPAASFTGRNVASRDGGQSAGVPTLTASPDMLLFDLVKGGKPDPETTVVTISAENTTTPVGALSVSGAPAWLSARPSAAGKAIVNTINTAALTTFGTLEETITVSDAGTGLTAAYVVTINYKAPEVNPISVKQPNATTRLKTGDSLKVIYTADCFKVAAVTVKLSVDSGENYTRLHLGNSMECGTDRALVWKITDSLMINNVKVATASANCVVLVSSYYSAEYALSEVFAIDPQTSVLPGHDGGRGCGPGTGLAMRRYDISGRPIAPASAVKNRVLIERYSSANGAASIVVVRH